MLKPVRTIATTALLATSLSVLGAGTAHAGSGDVRRQGSCSGATDWKIKAGPHDGRIEVEAEIDSNRSGQTWHWALRHDGVLVDRGTAVTQPPSGSFEVRRRTADHAGSDAFRFRAVNRASGEVCVARVTL